MYTKHDLHLAITNLFLTFVHVSIEKTQRKRPVLNKIIKHVTLPNKVIMHKFLINQGPFLIKSLSTSS